MKVITNRGISPTALLFTIKNMENNLLKVEMWSNQKIEEGVVIDSINSFGHQFLIGKNYFPVRYFEIVKINKNRDSRGIFKNPEDKIKSFYEILMKPLEEKEI